MSYGCGGVVGDVVVVGGEVLEGFEKELEKDELEPVDPLAPVMPLPKLEAEPREPPLMPALVWPFW